MDHIGLVKAARYSYPPNSLSLCGPSRQKDLAWYATSLVPDKGTAEILGKFSTLYPYLCLIASENKLHDPFDRRVIEAYWLGNSLLRNVPAGSLHKHLYEGLNLKKKQSKKDNDILSAKVAGGAVPNHAFHVLNVYIRTGTMHIPHTVETMDACIINSGKITELVGKTAVVLTRPLGLDSDKIGFGPPVHRLLHAQGENDSVFTRLAIGDWVSYHWGYVCEKISLSQRNTLKAMTQQAIDSANSQA